MSHSGCWCSEEGRKREGVCGFASRKEYRVISKGKGKIPAGRIGNIWGNVTTVFGSEFRGFGECLWLKTRLNRCHNAVVPNGPKSGQPCFHERIQTGLYAAKALNFDTSSWIMRWVMILFKAVIWKVNRMLKVFKKSSLYASIFVLSISATASQAGICDYRLSQFIGGTGAEVVGGAAAGTAASGAALSAAGFYTLTNAVTGATMLGSTAAGASAAGTVGIIAGTGGIIGTAGAILMAPATITAGAVAAVGIGGLEAVCYFQDERITDHVKVLAIMKQLAKHADPNYFILRGEKSIDAATVDVRDADGNMVTYRVKDLYIVNGVLKNSDWGPNTVIGRIDYIMKDNKSAKN